MKYLFLVLTVGWIFFHPNLIAQSDDSLHEQIEEIIEDHRPDSLSGLSLLIFDNKKILFKTELGLSNREKVLSLNEDDRFYLASLSKIFTASAILKLMEEGQITPDNNLTQFFPEFSQYEEATIHQLLSHTSGIPDYYQYLSWPMFNGLSNQDVLDTLRTKPLNFEPGLKFQYSNSNYVFLSMIVEKVTDQSLGEFAESEFFDPLQMRHTFFYEDIHKEYAHRAHGYSILGGNRVPMDYMHIKLSNGGSLPMKFTTTGGGGMYSNAKDLHAWLTAYSDQKVLKGNLYKSAIKPQVSIQDYDTSGLMLDSIGYGYGWYTGIDPATGDRIVWHGGNFVGFSNFVLLKPEQGFGIIALSNDGTLDTKSLVFKLVSLY